MADFDYVLPKELIAQAPLSERDASRLMVLDRASRTIQHRLFRDLPSLLSSGDLLVVNDSRVIPARLAAQKPTGGRVELLLLRRTDEGFWEALAKPARRLHVGIQLQVHPRSPHGGHSPEVTVEAIGDEGQVLLRLDPAVEQDLGHFGVAPLPPYIEETLDDEERYQTVYAREPGSAAAPTAGLHFSERLLAEIQEQGVEIASVTLHVGLSTFRPVTAEFAEDHHIHSEWCEVGAAASDAIVRAKQEGRRVIAVGTTAARTLETLGHRLEQGWVGPFRAATELYILPGYRWRLVDGLITNFHLPRSTLLLMVSALASKEFLAEAYGVAIQSRYRFYSFGDAMLIV
ncbi:MAG: tRNA preQ1(34) S-adenosylmethionine ribosyltransferase-isomerase QueA [Chloroflexota bacterium]|nr:tRNA preQ1(34) S-adenosylmethionine ribosyltransferase-isomerase QueA [Chloroflexota bacterium]